MTNGKTHLYCLVILIAQASCNQTFRQTADSDDRDIAEIMKVITTIDSLGAEEDMTFLDYYEDGMIWMYPWEWEDKNKDYASGFYRHLFESWPGAFKDNTMEINEIGICGDYAFLRGTWRSPPEIDSTDGTTRRSGSRHMMIFRKQADGSWKIHRDIFNNPDPVQ